MTSTRRQLPAPSSLLTTLPEVSDQKSAIGSSRTSGESPPVIREDVLRDPRYPVHKIADKLLPYLRVLVEQFRPEQVILFGSYAYGHPDEHSDVDLLVVKDTQASGVRELAAILKAWRSIRWQGGSLPFELLIETPANHATRAKKQGSFYAQVVHSGVRLV